MTKTNPSRRKAATSKPVPINPRTLSAVRLDVLAGIELAHGHHGAAEFLAHRAAQLREARQ